MGHVTYFFKFWDPFHISETAEARNFKFGTQIGHWGSKWKSAKLGQKGQWKGHVTYFLKFWYPLYISGTVEARNFKFDRQMDTEDTNEKMQN